MAKTNAWRAHVQAFMKSNPGMKVTEVFKAAAKTYKKKQSGGAPAPHAPASARHANQRPVTFAPRRGGGSKRKRSAKRSAKRS